MKALQDRPVRRAMVMAIALLLSVLVVKNEAPQPRQQIEAPSPRNDASPEALFQTGYQGAN
jgi:hypothetical protein